MRYSALAASCCTSARRTLGSTRLGAHSFVDIQALGSPEALVAHVKQCEANATMYASYFTWRPDYNASPLAALTRRPHLRAGYHGSDPAVVGCELCKRVHHVRAGCALVEA